MSNETLTQELTEMLSLPEPEVIRKGLLALIEKEIRLAEWEMAEIRDRYSVPALESLYQAIEQGRVPGHPAWEDYIVWKNKSQHVAQLRRMMERANPGPLPRR